MISDFNKLNCQNVTQKLWRQNLSSFSGSVKNQLELSHDMPQACKFEPFYLFVSMCSNDSVARTFLSEIADFSQIHRQIRQVFGPKSRKIRQVFGPKSRKIRQCRAFFF